MSTVASHAWLWGADHAGALVASLDAGTPLQLALSIHGLVVSYGWLAIVVLVGLESLGIPVPGETVLIAAGTYAGAKHTMSPWVVFGAAAAGAIAGDTIGYFIGRFGGYRLLRRYGRHVRFDEPKIKVARYLFDLHGGKVVFFGRFVSILRTYAAFLAGTMRMRWPRFAFFNSSGGIIWAAAFGFGAYYAGGTIERLSGTITVVVAVAAVVVIAAAAVLGRRSMRALKARAEAAYPGPLEEA